MNCKYEGCERPVRYKVSGICNTHYQKEWRAANPDKLKEQQKRYYEKHVNKRRDYQRKWRNDNIETVRRNARHYMAMNSKKVITREHITDSVKERFFAKVDKTDTCWNWTGAKTANRPKRNNAPATKGYGSITISNRPFYVHRLSWLMYRGDLIDGLVIDHLCDNSLCVNPDHLQQVTNNENTMRSPRHSVNGGGYYKGKSTCKYGHSRIPGNSKPCETCYQEKRKRNVQKNTNRVLKEIQDLSETQGM